MKLIEAYANATALFTGITLPEAEHTEQIKSLIFGRWAPYDLCMDDKDEWHAWFQYLCTQNWTLADRILASADLIEDPLKTFHKQTVTDGEVQTTDTLKIEDDVEGASATSGYNNTNSKTTDEANGTQTAGIHTTTVENPGKTTTTKVSDTPQSAVSNLTSGYLSNVTQVSEAGSNTTTVTPTGTDSNHAESETNGESRSNYLDANSNNSHKTSQHSGGVKTEDDTTVTEDGFNGNLSELLKTYRETLENMNRKVADMWNEAFVLVLGCYTPGSIWEV